MKEIKSAKHITPMEIAKKIGMEKEYKDALFEQELKKNHNVITGDEYEDIEKNNFIINGDGT
jgi:hypothetical protein